MPTDPRPTLTRAKVASHSTARAPAKTTVHGESGFGARRVSAETVAANVMRLLEERVFLPGDRLIEQDLADRFGVSRGPVREALRILEAKSVVRIEPMRGATIARLTDEEARESVDASAVLFGLAARRAAARAEAKGLKALKEHVARLREMIGLEIEPKAFFRQTLRCGRVVLEMSGSPRIAKLVVDVRFGAPDYYGPLGFTTSDLRRQAHASWRALAAALESRDGDQAERLGRKVHDDAMEAALKVAP